jgi:single-stranded-DNA-specific exonuclease RecJ
MSVTNKRWIISTYQSYLQLKISEELNISPVLAQLCINRGMITVQEVAGFIRISPTEVKDPFLFCHMRQAVDIVEETIRNQEKILIYGDYDVDGITAVSLLYLYLKSRTNNVSYYIPDRLEEGYGLNEEALLWAAREGYKLIITVDCGISSRAEAARAKELGVKLIITDHHTPPPVLPEAAAILNPKVPDSGYPFSELAGVGVAWKLAQALELSSGKGDSGGSVVLEDYLDLVALGTVADVVPLLGENRVIVAWGLKKIEKTQRKGIKALLKVTGLDQKPLTSGHIGFMLAPRLNAVGRLAQGSLAVELLTGEDENLCEIQAKELDQMNYQRQEVEREILNQALHMVEKEIDLEQDFVIVLAHPDWHPGVIGIVASRLMEKYYRPVVLLAIEGDMAKGSARSIEQFDIYQAFKHCQDLLVQFGGHKMAAGVKIRTENIAEFRKAINNYANSCIDKELAVPAVKIDLELAADGKEELYINDCEKLFPFGLGNAQPVFAYRNLRVLEAKTVGNNQEHVKIVFDTGDYLLDGIGFGLSHQFSWLREAGRVDAAVTLEKNCWNGCERVQLVIKDIQPHQPGPAFSPPELNRKTVLWADFRNGENREAYLMELLKKNEPCLIYVSTREEAAALKQIIENQNLTGIETDECHECQSPWQQALVLARVRNKARNTVILAGVLRTDFMTLDIKDLFKHLVFFHCPRNMDDFLHLVYLFSSAKRGKIHLLFNQDDLKILDQHLKIYYPDRELLGKIYWSVKSMATSTNQIIGSREDILKKVQIDGLEKGKEKVFHAWISIMKEIGLLKLSISGNRYCLELAHNGNKFKLEDSTFYREGIKVKEAFRTWAGIALSPRLQEEICLRS